MIGIYLANRSLDMDDLTELAAPTFNLVPLRISTSGSSIIESALRVQRDLSEISRLEYCGVSMRDIHTWTGITVDTYVNFLTLPGEEDAGDELEGESGDGDHLATPARSSDNVGGVSVTHIKVDSEMKRTSAEIIETSPLFNESVDQGLTNHDWCLVSLDL